MEPFLIQVGSDQYDWHTHQCSNIALKFQIARKAPVVPVAQKVVINVNACSQEKHSPGDPDDSRFPGHLGKEGWPDDQLVDEEYCAGNNCETTNPQQEFAIKALCWVVVVDPEWLKEQQETYKEQYRSQNAQIYFLF